MKVILWDWNGTLVDDVHAGLQTFNETISHFCLKPIDLPYYREIYRHPVIEMYRDVGFSGSACEWEELCEIYETKYALHSETISLQHDTRTTLARFSMHGYRQAIVSALSSRLLEEAVTTHGLRDIFEGVYGVNGSHGRGKCELAHRVVKQLGTSGKHVTIIGDSSHDAEVAREIGASCILVSRGFESVERLKRNKVPVVDSFSAVLDLFKP